MRRFLIPLLPVLLVAGPAQAAPPGNDDPANAIAISSFPATIDVDTSDATTGPYEAHCSNSVGGFVGIPIEAVWYRLDLPSGTERIRIMYEEYDASVSLWALQGWTPTGAPILLQEGCLYAEDPYPLYVDGQSLYMSVGSLLTSATPPFQVRVEAGEVAVANDAPYRATKILSLPYEVEQGTWDAGYDNDPQGCPQGAYVWYTYTPSEPQTIEVSVSTRFAYEGSTVAVYALGDEVRTLGCDGGWDTGVATVATPVEAGVPVLIGIGGPGLLTLSVRTIPGPGPGPDARASAVPLTFGSAVSYDTSGATLEPEEPTSCGSGGSLWFELPPGRRGAEVVVSGAVSIAAVVGDEVLACSTTGTLGLPTGSPATHVQLRAPGAVAGTIALRFAPPYGDQLTDVSPFTRECGDSTDGPYMNSEVEVSLTVDPHDPNHLLATWQQDRHSDRGGSHGIGAAATFDGGATWTNTTIPGVSLCSGGLFLRATDPWAAIDADGTTAYVMSLGYDPGPNDLAFLPNSVLLSRSEDGGLTWAAPVVVAVSPGILMHDKEALTADPSTPGLLYAVWDIYPTNVAFPVFARSEDGGRTWTPPVPLPTTGGGAGDQIAVLDDGTLVEIANRDSMQSITSRDRGLTWSLPTGFAAGGSAEGPPGVRGGAYIPSVSTDGQAVFVSWSDTYSTFFARSDDAGATWTVREVAGGGYSYPRRFTTAVAGTDSGRLAVMTYLIDEADRAWIALAISADGGTTWTEQPITDSFDMRRAPESVGRGYFLGDYFGVLSVARRRLPSPGRAQKQCERRGVASPEFRDHPGVDASERPAKDERGDERIVERPEDRDELGDQVDRGGDPQDGSEKQPLRRSRDARVTGEVFEQKEQVREQRCERAGRARLAEREQRGDRRRPDPGDRRERDHQRAHLGETYSTE
ncbi:MAG: exo-alpha-sialidase [Acidobacteria bacterium]|nr:exo-alpha-sialidase [Acidobacteriota bacterium]